MIIGLIGPCDQDTQSIVDVLTDENSIQYVDGNTLVRSLDRRHMYSVVNSTTERKNILLKLKSHVDTMIVSGNLLLTEDICEWILNEGGVVCVISRGSLDSYNFTTINLTGTYWGDPGIQQYEMVTRYKEQYLALSKSYSDNLYLVDLSDEDSEDLVSLVEESKNWKDSRVIVEQEELVKIVQEGVGGNVTMEDSIRKAMVELGVPLDDEPKSIDTPKKMEPISKKNVTKKNVDSKKKVTKKKVKHEIATPEVEPQQLTIFDIVESQEPEDNTEDESSVYVKVSENSMAIIFPKDMVLENRTIGEVDFNVVTVELPDINNHNLQELKVRFGSSKPMVKPTFKRIDTSDLEAMKAEKSSLDAQIRKARSEGDTDLVNTLRKQRRALRAKINKLNKE